MAPKLIVHDWNIKDGDYMRDANYDKLYLERKSRKEKIKKLVLAGAGMALIVIANLVYMNMVR